MKNKLIITSVLLLFSVLIFSNNSFNKSLVKYKSNVSQTTDSIIIKVQNKEILVASKDFETTMTWSEANDACQKLGPGWRLPDNLELEVIYYELYKKNKGNFYTQNSNLNESLSEYWSAVENKDLKNEAYYFCFALGIIQSTADSNGRDKDERYNVRAVKTIE